MGHENRKDTLTITIDININISSRNGVARDFNRVINNNSNAHERMNEWMDDC